MEAQTFNRIYEIFHSYDSIERVFDPSWSVLEVACAVLVLAHNNPLDAAKLVELYNNDKAAVLQMYVHARDDPDQIEHIDGSETGVYIFDLAIYMLRYTNGFTSRHPSGELLKKITVIDAYTEYCHNMMLEIYKVKLCELFNEERWALYLTNSMDVLNTDVFNHKDFFTAFLMESYGYTKECVLQGLKAMEVDNKWLLKIKSFNYGFININDEEIMQLCNDRATDNAETIRYNLQELNVVLASKKFKSAKLATLETLTNGEILNVVIDLKRGKKLIVDIDLVDKVLTFPLQQQSVNINKMLTHVLPAALDRDWTFSNATPQ